MFNLLQQINAIHKQIEQDISRMLETYPKVTLSVKTPDNLVDWTVAVRKIQGKNFSFEGREFLKPIYNDQSKRIMIVKPRQMEITEYAVNWLLYNLEKNPNTVGLYLTDRKSHISVFSKLRVRNRAIGESPILKRLTRKKGNVSMLEFTNGSILYMYSAKPDFESARSIPVDFAVIDEIQSTNVEAVPVLEEALAKSRFGKCLYIGTGSIVGDGWFKLWHGGDQKEWNDVTGTWVAKNPGSIVSSYHLSQSMAKDRLKEDLEYKKKTYTPRRYVNEVEGWWFGGAGKPLVELDITKLFDNAMDFIPSDDVDHDFPIFAGFDWGGGTQAYTVAWIWQLVNKDVPRFKVLNVIRIDDADVEVQSDKAIELIEKYHVDKIVCDSGGGTHQTQKLSKRYQDRVFKCHYVPNSDEPLKIISRKNQVHVDRTWLFDSMIDLIKRPEDNDKYPSGIPRVHIPHMNASKIDWMIDHFTCIEAQTVEGNRGSYVRYIHGEETNDDAFHAACYAYLAWVITLKQRWIWY